MAYNEKVISLSQTPFASLLSKARPRTFPKGQIILYQGDSPTDVYILKEGGVKLYEIDEQGNEKVLHVLQTAAVFPLMYHVNQHKQLYWFYTALSDVEVCTLSFAALKEAMEQDGKLAYYVLSRSTRESHELMVRLESMGKTTTLAKLVAALKFLAVHHADERRNGWMRIRFPVSHQLLADMTGITRESVSMAMKELQNEDIVRSPRLTMLEIDMEKLVNYTPTNDN